MNSLGKEDVQRSEILFETALERTLKSARTVYVVPVKQNPSLARGNGILPLLVEHRSRFLKRVINVGDPPLDKGGRRSRRYTPEVSGVAKALRKCRILNSRGNPR